MDHLGHSCTCTCHITQTLWVYLHYQLWIVLHLHALLLGLHLSMQLFVRTLLPVECAKLVTTLLPVKRAYVVMIDGVIACTDIRILSKFSSNGIYKYIFTSSNWSLAYCFTLNNRATNPFKRVICSPLSPMISPLWLHFWLVGTITIGSNISITHMLICEVSVNDRAHPSLAFICILQQLVGSPWVAHSRFLPASGHTSF
jgi:hypothetical protein